MFRRPTANGQRRLTLTEVLLGLLVLSLIFAIMALRRLELERDDWRDRLMLTLKSTTDAARSSEKRLKQAIAIVKEKDQLGAERGPADAGPSDDDAKGIQAVPSVSVADIAYDIDGKTTVILFCYNRADYLERTLENLATRLATATGFASSGLRIVISQDGHHDAVGQTAVRFVNRFKMSGYIAEHVQHTHVEFPQRSFLAPYYSLASHYAKGLDYAFNDGSKRAIVIEDDLEMAVDFFPYFEAFAPMLDEDESLMAVSAWNDNGQESHVKDSRRLYRTEIFPGLGWMVPVRIWNEFKPIWPEAFWDDWLRNRKQRKGRHIIQPEVSRTITFGRSGASQGQFFDTYLSTMRLNSEPVRFRQNEIDAMKKEEFDAWFTGKVNLAKPVNKPEEIPEAGGTDSLAEYRLQYYNDKDYEQLANVMGIMNDFKDNMPRCAYRGVVPVRYRGRQVFITPPQILPL